MAETIGWQNAFTQREEGGDGGITVPFPPLVRSLRHLRQFLDRIHIRQCLLKPYFEYSDYPLVESRELLPSFECDPFEYTELPGFSMLALPRQLKSFQEIFQFDILSPGVVTGGEHAESGARNQSGHPRNVQTFLNRLPKHCQEEFKESFSGHDLTDLHYYADLMPSLLQLDRAHVLAMNDMGNFYLAGVYASFPSDLDSELKRFGMRIGKFTVGDNELYERNRAFVYQFLMELYGFPIVSERRTSSALFARRLHKLGEPFLIKVLGQSDRTLTTLYTDPQLKIYPRVEKIALVRVEKEQKDIIRQLESGGYFVDPDRRVVILRVRYRQHKYNPHNVHESRALSVESQEVIHPLTGQILQQCNIIKDTYNMFLRLNDIVRGEYTGRIIFKRYEVVENTDTVEKRLKFLYAWLSKHQHRIITYTDDFFAKIALVLDNYLLNPDNYDIFQDFHELHQEVWIKYCYIHQARKVKRIEDAVSSGKKGKQFSYRELLENITEVMHDLKFEIVNYFDELVGNVIFFGEKIMNDNYLLKNYIQKRDNDLTSYGMDIKKQYRKLVSLVDDFKAIRKARSEPSGDSLLKAG